MTVTLRPMASSSSTNKKSTSSHKRTPTERLHWFVAQNMRDAAGLSYKGHDSKRRRVDRLLNDSALDAWTRLLRPSLFREARAKLLDAAKIHAMACFGDNVKSLLMQPPLPLAGSGASSASAIGSRNVLGVDPGFRAGCKLAAINHLGNVMETSTVHPHPPQRATREAQNVLLRMIAAHNIGTIAIGNGTASRETEALVAALVANYNQYQRGSSESSSSSSSSSSSTTSSHKVKYVVVSEAGASVYSTSSNATAEFGREANPLFIGAVSIARRLQDPLSELVKIPPRSMGVGMYQVIKYSLIITRYYLYSFEHTFDTLIFIFNIFNNFYSMI